MLYRADWESRSENLDQRDIPIRIRKLFLQLAHSDITDLVIFGMISLLHMQKQTLHSFVKVHFESPWHKNMFFLFFFLTYEEQRWLHKSNIIERREIYDRGWQRTLPYSVIEIKGESSINLYGERGSNSDVHRKKSWVKHCLRLQQKKERKYRFSIVFKRTRDVFLLMQWMTFCASFTLQRYSYETFSNSTSSMYTFIMKESIQYNLYAMNDFFCVDSWHCKDTFFSTVLSINQSQKDFYCGKAECSTCTTLL